MYELWTLRADGSALERISPASQSPMTYPFWSPDGRRLALTLTTRGAAILDLALPVERQRPVSLPPVTLDGQIFYAVSWSPDGKWLAGSAESRDARSQAGIVLYSLASKSYTWLSTRGEVPRWLPGGRALLALDQGRIIAVGFADRSVRQVLAPPANSSFISHCVSPDGRALFVARVSEEGDICRLTLQ
jgi:hypothetical protein